MPFIGSDWRSPGDQWVPTELGWKRLADINASLQRQLSKVAAGVSTIVSAASLKRNTSGSRNRSSCGSPPSSTRISSRASSRASSPCRIKQKDPLDEDKRWTSLLQLTLGQRCVSARKSSRESNHYTTISDALNKLNFNQALLDINSYPFICQVVEVLFEGYYWSLSGSMQVSLLRLTETAKDIAMENRQHTGYILRLIKTGITTLEKGRSRMMTGFSILRLDTKIKALLSSRAQLTSELQKQFSDETLPRLPNDCWRHVISFLVNPRDILNLGSVNRTLHYLVSEDLVWNNLITHHYGKRFCIKPGNMNGAMDHFKEVYMSSGVKLKVQTSHAAVLCSTCHCVYWRDYGHPCTPSLRGSVQLTQLDGKKGHCKQLTSRQFVELYH